ncbi:unnamed protein product [Sphenostylis stenocarpa]|uniref:Uncharacterized protein n=1 Tax=Sphenostylis stenocarpa TaxID=92480 RepID=A0AA86V9P4_9FABA|nr:unnamed protein product [Sphenostylis stenocarpa]
MKGEHSEKDEEKVEVSDIGVGSVMHVHQGATVHHAIMRSQLLFQMETMGPLSPVEHVHQSDTRVEVSAILAWKQVGMVLLDLVEVPLLM